LAAAAKKAKGLTVRRMDSNPYKPPLADASRQLSSALGSYALLAIATLPSALVAIGVLFVVPQFTGMFETFGASLPIGTRILLATFQWWGIVPLVLTGLWMCARRATNQERVVAALGIVSAPIMFIFGLWACYQPIFDLAANA
jgi:type II secretory pathway component PulF